MDYALEGLSTRSFEQMVQSLSLAVFGSQVTTFGDGRDGGREATFQGEVDYQTNGATWDGYGVIQAKFRQVPLGTEKDGKWALKELKKEIEDFQKPESRRRKPEYYLFVTNVRLSAVEHTGTKDLLVAKLKEFATSAGLKGVDVWDYDKLRSLLEVEEAIRRNYAAWITPGDVLSKLLDQLGKSDESAEELVSSILPRQFFDELSSNLEQAGHSADNAVPLARVFVDLPITFHENTDFHEDILVIEHLLDLAHTRLDPRTMATTGVDPKLARFVLVGGPGQGKSTVGQFLCQLFRASLLTDAEPALLGPELQTAVHGFIRHVEDQGLRLPSVRRFPIRIVLNAYARYLAEAPEAEASLDNYIVSILNKRRGSQVTLATVRSLLFGHPCVLVLDGLDEVPSSTNRDDVLISVRDFLLDASSRNADIFVLATTRPQGYNQDWSPQFYTHAWLRALDADRALAYGNQLANTRYGYDSDRAQKVKVRLHRATEQESTARLMRTPLQVTIMSLLVERTGQPPQEQWALFKEYYQLIYSRELERDIPAAAILRDHKSDIDAIHHEVGFILQAASESAGSTEARLTSQELRAVVERRLRSEGHDGSELSRLSDQILDGAQDRLVFLVGAEADAIGFEIRSLQEFMAAEALFDGTDVETQARLTHIAGIINWRNAFLFAAGRCFRDAQHQRDTLVRICGELNQGMDDDQTARRLRAGSRLALELLEDGSCRTQPKYLRLFWALATELTLEPDDEVHRRLVAVGADSQPELLLELCASCTRSLMEQGGIRAETRPLWHTMLLLSVRHDGALQALIDGYGDWPEESAGNAAELLDTAAAVGATAFLIEKGEKLLQLAGFVSSQIARHPDAWRRPSAHNLSGLPSSWVSRALTVRLLGIRQETLSIPLRPSGHGAAASMTINVMSITDERYADLADAPPGAVSSLYAGVARLSQELTSETLAQVLEAAEPHLATLTARTWATFDLPWLVSGLIQLMQESPGIAADVRAGTYGGPTEWLATELKLSTEGLVGPDISRPIQLVGTDRAIPFTRYSSLAAGEGDGIAELIEASLNDIDAAVLQPASPFQHVITIGSLLGMEFTCAPEHAVRVLEELATASSPQIELLPASLVAAAEPGLKVDEFGNLLIALARSNYRIDRPLNDASEGKLAEAIRATSGIDDLSALAALVLRYPMNYGPESKFGSSVRESMSGKGSGSSVIDLAVARYSKTPYEPLHAAEALRQHPFEFVSLLEVSPPERIEWIAHLLAEVVLPTSVAPAVTEQFREAYAARSSGLAGAELCVNLGLPWRPSGIARTRL